MHRPEIGLHIGAQYQKTCYEIANDFLGCRAVRTHSGVFCHKVKVPFWFEMNIVDIFPGSGFGAVPVAGINFIGLSTKSWIR